jgi:pimeloyl-ACP methyl ester carboxylesterase
MQTKIDMKLKYGSTLATVQLSSNSNLGWLWIPGGPGLGSSYLAQLAMELELPGNHLTLDLPRREAYAELPQWPEIYRQWKSDLLEALSKFERVVVVGHSFGGMLALSTPGAEKLCAGAVLLDSSPNPSWMTTIPIALTHVNADENRLAEEDFAQNPSDAALRNLFRARAAAYFRPEALTLGQNLFAEMPCNHFPFLGCWDFFSSYKCEWTDWKFPTLAVAGDSDLITPPGLFAADPFFAGKKNVELSTVKNAGHFPWIEQPSEFKKIMKKFADTAHSK